MSELIRLQNIHKTYHMGPDTIQVLRGINLSVNEGEFVAIMGSSGSGKSTLLHIAGALDQPDLVAFSPDDDLPEDSPAPQPRENTRKKNHDLTYTRQPQGGPSISPDNSIGEVFFKSQPLSAMSRWTRHRLRNRSFGFVFQFYHLLPELNVLENVLLPAMIEQPFYKTFLRARPRKAEALALLDSFGLSHRLKHRPAQLSGGERQRVAIARALINHPALLLADEPTGNLDAKTGRAILDVLLNLHQSRNQTILLVTHDPQVAQLADRTVHLTDGRIK